MGIQIVLNSIYEDKANITGYIYFSLIDAYEFNFGYTSRFGLYDVDFGSPNKTRTARDSAKYYTCLTQNRTLTACDFLGSGVFSNCLSLTVIVFCVSIVHYVYYNF
ncbi:unnamed protein product [Leptidea sinapis]|uniref:Uncharacterized protein n=1 Tax=Leptidea sinapis TaxID=189913 RepID=A0A5E4Q7W7_9NEOP|nr:unnamed protein product [Leptidea sinapis]